MQATIATTNLQAAPTFEDLQRAEQLEAEAYSTLYNLEAGTSTEQWEEAAANYRVAYLHTRELASRIAYDTAVDNQNREYECERISACYVASQSPRLDPQLFVRLYNYLIGACRECPIPEGWQTDDTFLAGLVSGMAQLDKELAKPTPAALLSAVENIVLDLDVWGVPKQ